MQSLTLMNTRQGTYAMGGQDKDRNGRNEVLQLDCLDQIQSCRWKEVGNLQFARSSHVAIALPEEYYDIYCTTTTDKTAQHNGVIVAVTTTIDKTAQHNGIIVAFSILLLLLCFLLSWKFAIVPKMPWFYR